MTQEGPPARQRFVVDATEAGLRVDAVVARRLGIGTTAARRLVESGAVRAGNKRAVKGAHLEVGTTLEIVGVVQTTTAAAPVLADPSLSVTVVYEDSALIAIDKPAGVPSHPLRPGELGTAANAIVARWPECAVASEDVREGGIAHRLDTPTSGVLLAARSRAVWTALRLALAAPECEKLYLCLVRGTPPDEGSIDVEIGRRGRRGSSVRVGGGRRPQPAETRWTVVGRGADTALVEARLHAGRPHQVRAHLAAAGYPIVGDDRYGADIEDAAPPATNLRLHAAAIRLGHPVTGAVLVIAAPPPPWANSPFDAGAPRGT